MNDSENIKDQIQRCRRLARSINDAQARNSLEKMAQDYEGQLQPRDGSGDARFEAP